MRCPEYAAAGISTLARREMSRRITSAGYIPNLVAIDHPGASDLDGMPEKFVR